MDIVVLLIILFWVGKIFYGLQKSHEELVKGLNSLDERLSKIEENTRAGATKP